MRSGDWMQPSSSSWRALTAVGGESHDQPCRSRTRGIDPLSTRSPSRNVSLHCRILRRICRCRMLACRAGRRPAVSDNRAFSSVAACVHMDWFLRRCPGWVGADQNRVDGRGRHRRPGSCWFLAQPGQERRRGRPACRLQPSDRPTCPRRRDRRFGPHHREAAIYCPDR
jgi:hypothetical protein